MRFAATTGMTFETAWPIIARCQRSLRVEGRVLGLAADRGRIEEHLGALEHHRAGALGEPLVPADADADLPEPRRARRGSRCRRGGSRTSPRSPARRGCGSCGRRRAACRRRRSSRASCSRRAPPARRTRPGSTTPSSSASARKRAIVGLPSTGLRPGEELVLLLAAEVRPLEELGRQDDLRALLRRLAHQADDLVDVLVHVARAERALERRDGDLRPESRRSGSSRGPSGRAGSCWVMQWNAPPPREDRLARGTPTSRRPGKSVAIAATACVVVRRRRRSARPPSRLRDVEVHVARRHHPAVVPRRRGRATAR